MIILSLTVGESVVVACTRKGIKAQFPLAANLLAHREILAPLYASAWQRPTLTKWPIPVCQLSPQPRWRSVAF